MKFKSYKDASNRLSVAVEGMPSLVYRFVAWKIKKKFNLTKQGSLNQTLDEKFQKYEKDGALLSIDWDIWSGFVVTALNEKSKDLVTEIGKYLQQKYD